MNNSSSNHYSPSVPISVYRELAAELSSTRTQMETYKFQNQQLVEQNQKLRLEIERVVQSTLHLRQIADGHNVARPFTGLPLTQADYIPASVPPPPLSQTATAAAKPRPTTLKRPAVGPKRGNPDRPDRLVTEQQEPQPQRSAGRAAQEINGWWLSIIIGMIIVTAFGTGFLIVRPLLPSR